MPVPANQPAREAIVRSLDPVYSDSKCDKVKAFCFPYNNLSRSDLTLKCSIKEFVEAFTKARIIAVEFDVRSNPVNYYLVTSIVTIDDNTIEVDVSVMDAIEIMYFNESEGQMHQVPASESEPSIP